jgi:hypothetical protein
LFLDQLYLAQLAHKVQPVAKVLMATRVALAIQAIQAILVQLVQLVQRVIKAIQVKPEQVVVQRLLLYQQKLHHQNKFASVKNLKP